MVSAVSDRKEMDESGFLPLAVEYREKVCYDVRRTCMVVRGPRSVIRRDFFIFIYVCAVVRGPRSVIRRDLFVFLYMYMQGVCGLRLPVMKRSQGSSDVREWLKQYSGGVGCHAESLNIRHIIATFRLQFTSKREIQCVTSIYIPGIVLSITLTSQLNSWEGFIYP